MGTLVLTRRAGESIVLMQNGKKLATLTVELFRDNKASFTIKGAGYVLQPFLRPDHLFDFAGGKMSWLPGKNGHTTQIRIGLKDFPASVQILREELLV